jgi:RimJ/RimL family protein N-acetyltransferase
VGAPPVEFNTPRLAFRVWRDVHRPAFAAMNCDAVVMRYFPALQTTEQSNASVDAWLAHFAQHGWGNWAVELIETGEFIGFIGLNVPRRQLPFSPCVEVGWRLKRSAWGNGFATEGAKACLRLGFEQLDLEEVVSFTALLNTPSIAVMRRIGMKNAKADFEHPAVPEGNALRPHCLYKLTRSQWRRSDA